VKENPFYYGGAITDEHFCNRTSEIKELQEDIYSGLNTLIYAPRRFGKTSFVLKTLQSLPKQKIKYLFLDLMYISTLDEFINKYFNALASSLQEPTDKVINFFKSIIKLRPNINVNFDSMGNPSFSLSLNNEDKIKTLEDVLNIPLSFAKDNTKVVIVFDEFQELVNLDLEAKLRSVIQHHANKVSYIFMGSKKSLLHQMFLNKTRAFYKSVKHFKIKEINKQEWDKFIKKRFEDTNKTIDTKYINMILDITKGFPYYTQQFAYEIWSLTQKKVDNDKIIKSLNNIISREEDLFALEWDNLTPNQKKAIKIILNKDGKNIYDEQQLALYQIKIGSIQTALKGLLQKDIVDKISNKYYFQDPLFEYWLKCKV
jgi:hypothetical protein